MPAALLLASGQAGYEAVLRNNLLIFVCVFAKGCMQEMVWIEPDKCESMLHVDGQAGVLRGGVYGVVS